METETTLAKVIEVADDKVKYDAVCKRLLSEKYILAWIMKCCMKEFVSIRYRKLYPIILVELLRISEVSISPDETNSSRIDGTGLEDTTITEGTITYDIRFLLRHLIQENQYD